MTKGTGRENVVASTAYHGALEQCRKAAILQSDADMLQAFPMAYHANQSPLRESLPYEAVKELRNSLRDYGTQTNLYTQSFGCHCWQLCSDPLRWENFVKNSFVSHTIHFVYD